jgi:hypothetical protein
VWPSFLVNIKESPKKYKGKFAIGPYLLSFRARGEYFTNNPETFPEGLYLNAKTLPRKCV